MKKVWPVLLAFMAVWPAAAMAETPLPTYVGGAPPIAFTIVQSGQRVVLPAGKPAFQPLMKNAVNAYQQQGPEAALLLLSQALPHYPNHSALRAMMGELLLELKRPGDALVQLQAAAATDPTHHHERFQSLLQAYLPQAEPALLAALKESPQASAPLHDLLAQYYERQGQAEKALEHLQQLSTQQASTHARLGLCYELLGQPDQALLHYHEALTRDPQSEMAQLGRDRLKPMVATQPAVQSTNK
jgi:tetratricopeptide (TPR) repeat protein